MEVNEISSRFDYELSKEQGVIVLDEYNKSLYLTKAQQMYVENSLKNFEYGDYLRHLLGDLIVEANATPIATGETAMWEVDSQEDIQQILYEHINGSIKTIPLDYNDLHDARVNPFRKPHEKLAYRLIGRDTQKLIIFSTTIPTDYFYVYCKEPQPIVLEDLSTTDLNVDGVQLPQGSELPYRAVLNIITAAVQMAVAGKARYASSEKQE